MEISLLVCPPSFNHLTSLWQGGGGAALMISVIFFDVERDCGHNISCVEELLIRLYVIELLAHIRLK